MEAHLNYLDKLEHKPVPKSASENHVNVQYYDRREVTNVNRELVLSKIHNYLGIVVDKRKGEKITHVLPTPKINHPNISTSLAERSFPKKIDTNIEEEQVPQVETPSIDLQAPKSTEQLPPPPPKEPTAQPVSEKPPLPPSGIEPKTAAPKRRKLKVSDKTVVQNVDLTTAEINGRLVNERLPKPEKIVMKAPSYYMANRKIYVQKLSELFKEYNKQLLDEAAVASCDSRTTSNTTEMMIHQKVARDYLNLYTPYRGLLLYFGLGAGKTAASISIAEGMKSQKRVFVLTPASLKMNYFSELKKYGDPIFRKNQYWEFVSTEGNPQYVDILSQVLSLPRQFVLQNKGAWLVDITKTNSNFKDLSAKDQQMLDEQLNHMIRSKYVDINYNGLNSDKLNALVQKYGENPFDHSVVVIDEAHNLVSRIMNKRNRPDSVSSRIYQMLLSATDVRIVLLSGTPIINYPAEVGIMFNILRGYITTWKFKIKPPPGFESNDILKIFDEEDFRFYDYIDYTNGELTVTRNPFGFGYMKKAGAEKGQKHHRKEKGTPPQQPDIPPLPKPVTIVPAKPKKKLVIKNTAEVIPNLPPPPPTETAKGGGLLIMGVLNKTKKNRVIDSIQEDIETSFLKKTRKNRSCMNEEKISDEIDDNIIDDETESLLEEVMNDIGHEPSQPILPPKTSQNGSDYYVVEDGIIRLKDPSPEKENEINEIVENEVEKQYAQYQNGEGEYGMIKGGADLVFNRYKGVHLDEQGNISNDEFVNQIKKILRKHGIGVNDIVQTENYTCLPDTNDDFNSQFVDQNSVVMKEVNLFKKRILGLTSYFRSAQESLLPQFVKTDKGEIIHVVKCTMSDYQLEEYEEKRLAEMKMEENIRKRSSKKQAQEVEDKIASTYRIYSRVACNFVFPPTLPRPLPLKTTNIEEVIQNAQNNNKNMDIGAESAIDNIANENDEQIDVSDDQSVPNISDEYAKQIQETLNRLKTEMAQNVKLESGEVTNVEILSREGLKIHSPKYLEILKNLENEENKGLHLLYSNFRTLEGIGILKLILEKNGFAEFKLQKSGNEWNIMDTDPDLSKPRFALYTGTESADEKEMLRNIYNSNWDLIPPKIADKVRAIHANNYYGEVIKILMITASGAEGINLENTRFVHIVEPYWHMTRIDQVIGRARRICSHKNLPEEMRNVKVFMYMSSFSEEQVTGKKHIDLMSRDNSRLKKNPITTDEYLFENASIKNNLNNQILKSIKETAIDCNLYSQLNKGENLVCYGNQYGKVTSADFSAYPILEKDAKEKDDINIQEITVKLSKITTANGTQYVYNKENQELYDYNVYANSKQLILIGHLRDYGEYGKRIVLVKK